MRHAAAAGLAARTCLVASVALAAGALLAVAGCGAPGDGVLYDGVRPAGDGPVTIRVPRNAPTIGAAVKAARSGDMVLVEPGVYRETVRIRTPRIVLRGTDRSGVVIDGQGRRGNGVVVTASGVSVENLTVRNHNLYGVLVTGMTDADAGIGRGSEGYRRLDTARFPPLSGYRVRYVTAANNGLYGIYAFDARDGVIEHNYASGSADSGIYVGQCKPCDAVVRDNVAERNAVGFEGANSSGGLFVVRNRFTGNRVGLTIQSSHLEALVPQESATIVGNLVADNVELATPEQADGAFGLGIGLGGGHRNVIARNRVTGHARAGLLVTSVEDIAPLDNRIEGNVFAGNALDVAYAASARAPGRANCLRANVLATTAPAALTRGTACADGVGERPFAGATSPRGISFRKVAGPPPQPSLPPGTPAEPAPGLPDDVATDAIGVPPATLLAERAGR